MRFVIISTGWNCENNVYKNFLSVCNQTYKDWLLVMIDDGSNEDKTAEEVSKIVSEKVKIEIYNDNKGAAYRRYYSIHKYAESEDVVVLLGMDDELRSTALEKIKEQYDSGKLMTYGNWIDSEGKMLPTGFLDFSEETHKERNYRKERFRATGLNTFKKKLFNEFTEECFKFEGEWIKATTESNLMFSLLEMCGKERIGVIYKPICVYNLRGKMCAKFRFGKEYQLKIYNNVISKEKRNLFSHYENISACPAHG